MLGPGSSCQPGELAGLVAALPELDLTELDRCTKPAARMFGPRILRESIAPSPWRASCDGERAGFVRWWLRTVLAVDVEAAGETGDPERRGALGEAGRTL